MREYIFDFTSKIVSIDNFLVKEDIFDFTSKIVSIDNSVTPDVYCCTFHHFFSEREIDLISSNIKFLTLTVEEIENTLFVFTYIILNIISYLKYLNVPPFVEHNVFVCIIKSNKRMDGIQCI